MKHARPFLLAALVATTLSPRALSAQLGRQQGLVEPNVAADTAMAELPGMNQTIVDALEAARPILSITALDQLLAGKSLTPAQRTTLYGRMFVHVDLNRGTDAELMLIPGMDAKKLAAIKSGRPWKSFTDFASAMTRASSADEAFTDAVHAMSPYAVRGKRNRLNSSDASSTACPPRRKPS